MHSVHLSGTTKGHNYRSRNIPKFLRRNGSFLARIHGGAGLKLILLVICTLAIAGWIAAIQGALVLFLAGSIALAVARQCRI